MNIITKKQDRAPFKLAMPASQCGNIHPSAWHHGVFYPPSPDFSMPQCISVYSLSGIDKTFGISTKIVKGVPVVQVTVLAQPC